MSPPVSPMPLGRRKRADEIAEHIERAISTGEFKEGDAMPSEKELAERFGVGRPSVRQALFTLQQQGLVEIASGARARVTAPSGKFLMGQMASLIGRLTSTGQGQEHMEQARLLLEAGMAWQAARVATDEDIRRLKRALDANAAAIGNTSAFIRTDVAFHAELAAITRNPVFTSIYDALVGWLIDQRTTTIHMPDADRLSVRDHTSVYEAVAARDPMRAFLEMSSHLRLISELYRESKRLSEEILRQVAHDVAGRIERERESMWTAGGPGDPAAGSARAERKAGPQAPPKKNGGESSPETESSIERQARTR
jgi:DNA-binding FadR family transcriptional regulator